MIIYDILKLEGELWGTVLPNGTATGLARYLIEDRIDMSSLQHFCGSEMHFALRCSRYRPQIQSGAKRLTAKRAKQSFRPTLFVRKREKYDRTFGNDGHSLMLKRPGRKLQWTGLISPYKYEAWLAVGATLITATIILGLCLKYSSGKKIDWTLHFLDALHPLCGRNMMLPGFNAAHLGGRLVQHQLSVTCNNRLELIVCREKNLSLEIFLLTYCLACLVINTGYEGNLKSHLSAVVLPPPLRTLKDFGEDGGYRDILSQCSDKKTKASKRSSCS